VRGLLAAQFMPANLLVRGGTLTGVIDWGELGVGDPPAPADAALSALPYVFGDGVRRGSR
jgi:aminoglycoside phosphotransferase